LGGATTQRDRIAQLATPLLARARDELSESVSLAVLDHDKPLFIARAEAEHILSTGVRVGAHLPAYCSATGRVLLSQFSDEEISERLGPKPFHQRTPHTITRLAPLLAEIHAVHKRGYAMSDEELELGMRALAVPAFDESGAIIGAISVSAASARVRTADLRNQFLPVLQSCARALRNAIANSAAR
jgi:IclR family pca regulon transcriptional regulator